MRHPLILTASLAVTAMMATCARAQIAPPSPVIANAQWARRYVDCTNREILVQALRKDASPTPDEAVAATERVCAGELPPGATAVGQGGDSEAMQRFVARVHLDLRARFTGPTRLSTVAAAASQADSLERDRVIQGGTCPHPGYPSAAARAMAQGDTKVELIVDPEGHVSYSRISQNSGMTREHYLLDRTIREAYRACTFPAAQDSLPRVIELVYYWRID